MEKMLRTTSLMIAALAAFSFTSAVFAAPAANSFFSMSNQNAPLSIPVANNSVGGKRLGYTCEGLQCTCTGDADCNDMFSDGVCGDIASCTDDVCKCLKFKKAPKTPKTRGVLGTPGVKVK
jgi:hypothetical protein